MQMTTKPPEAFIQLLSPPFRVPTSLFPAFSGLRPSENRGSLLLLHFHSFAVLVHRSKVKTRVSFLLRPTTRGKLNDYGHEELTFLYSIEVEEIHGLCCILMLRANTLGGDSQDFCFKNLFYFL